VVVFGEGIFLVVPDTSRDGDKDDRPQKQQRETYQPMSVTVEAEGAEVSVK
jgi:hypothetical protein